MRSDSSESWLDPQFRDQYHTRRISVWMPEGAVIEPTSVDEARPAELLMVMGENPCFDVKTSEPFVSSCAETSRSTLR